MILSKDCPICLEDMTGDCSFFPCDCKYQICAFCWDRIKSEGDNRCPHCRQCYKSTSSMEASRFSNEEDKCEDEMNVEEKEKLERFYYLSNLRVLQEHLLFILNLPDCLADREILEKPEYLGKFGRIRKNFITSGSKEGCYNAYITFSKGEEAHRAKQEVNNSIADGRILKAALGTTKYCQQFLKGVPCKKVHCMYLHQFCEDEACFTKEEMQKGKHLQYESRLVEQYLKSLEKEERRKLNQCTKEHRQFYREPTAEENELIKRILNERTKEKRKTKKNLTINRSTNSLNQVKTSNMTSGINCKENKVNRSTTMVNGTSNHYAILFSDYSSSANNMTDEDSNEEEEEEDGDSDGDGEENNDKKTEKDDVEEKEEVTTIDEVKDEKNEENDEGKMERNDVDKYDEWNEENEEELEENINLDSKESRPHPMEVRYKRNRNDIHDRRKFRNKYPNNNYHKQQSQHNYTYNNSHYHHQQQQQQQIPKKYYNYRYSIDYDESEEIHPEFFSNNNNNNNNRSTRARRPYRRPYANNNERRGTNNNSNYYGNQKKRNYNSYTYYNNNYLNHHEKNHSQNFYSQSGGGGDADELTTDIIMESGEKKRNRNNYPKRYNSSRKIIERKTNHNQRSIIDHEHDPDRDNEELMERFDNSMKFIDFHDPDIITEDKLDNDMNHHYHHYNHHQRYIPDYQSSNYHGRSYMNVAPRSNYSKGGGGGGGGNRRASDRNYRGRNRYFCGTKKMNDFENNIIPSYRPRKSPSPSSSINHLHHQYHQNQKRNGFEIDFTSQNMLHYPHHNLNRNNNNNNNNDSDMMFANSINENDFPLLSSQIDHRNHSPFASNKDLTSSSSSIRKEKQSYISNIEKSNRLSSITVTRSFGCIGEPIAIPTTHDHTNI
ncbi:hypothetical protein SNEBB_002044 [Seison nebaliae]|nr:hypothetical protein SNEBB_002044 [Seison nebaliae]